MPVVHAERCGCDDGGLAGDVETGFRNFNRAAGLHVDMRRPRKRRELFGAQQLSSLRVEDIEEAVLRRLHHDAALAFRIVQVGDHDRLRRRIVPGFAGRCLIVPLVLAGVRVERDDGGQEQVVAAAGRAILLVPRRAVASADIDGVELGIVGHAVPQRAAAAELPELAIPRLAGFGEFRLLVAFGRIAGHGVPAPRLRAGLGVVGGDVAAHAVFGAAIPDDDLALHDARHAGDRVRKRGVGGLLLPDHLSGLAIKRDQAAVQHADIDLAVPSSDAAIDDVAAGVSALGAVDLRIVGPELRAGADVVGFHHRPRGGEVHHAIDDDGRGFLAALGVDVGIPGKTEFRDVGVVDLVERAEALFAIVAASGEPRARLVVGIDEAFGGDGGGAHRVAHGR